MSEEKLSMNYVLQQIEKIASETEYLYRTIEALKEIPPAAGPGDIVGSSRAEALAAVVKCRETTNQKMLALYEKMYDDLKPERADSGTTKKIAAMNMVENMFSSVDVDESILDRLDTVLETITRL